MRMKEVVFVEIRLSCEAENRLRNALIETLKRQINELETAFQSANISAIREIGHSLKGNSGAAYFKIEKVKEIGHYFQTMKELNEQEFRHQLQQLTEVMVQMEAYPRI
jgi:HPt (histidine-containing phosphotransfer) domain-containing protein